MVASNYLATRAQAHSPLLLVLALLAGILGVCQRIGSVAAAPNPVPEPASELTTTASQCSKSSIFHNLKNRGHVPLQPHHPSIVQGLLQ